MNEKVVIIGAGIAGIEAAVTLSDMGFDVTLLEKENKPGGKINKWYKLFTSKTPAHEIIKHLIKVAEQSNLDIIYNAEIISIQKQKEGFTINLNDNKQLIAQVLLITTGYDFFNARIKEEYGYGIYENVITSVELEERFAKEEPILTAKGKIPRRIGFIHCVGSRDEKVGNTYCSKVCCVTAVKQASSIREKFPKTEVYCFYMDMRMFGMNFEDLYKDSQEKWGVNYIRGRLSEACENIDGTILIKVEDTLAGRPLKMKLDLLVLMVGFVPEKSSLTIGNMLGIDLSSDGFFTPKDEHINTNFSNIPGVFFAGACAGPKTISDTVTDARAVATQISASLKK